MESIRSKCNLDQVHRVYGSALYESFVLDNSCAQAQFVSQMQDLFSLCSEGKISQCGGAEHISDDDILSIQDSLLAAFNWCALLQAWIKLMIQSRRLSHMEGALQVCYARVMRGHEELCIESAHVLSKKEQKILELLAYQKLGAFPSVVYKINPALLAGVCLRKGWKQIDMSLHSHIVRAKESLDRYCYE